MIWQRGWTKHQDSQKAGVQANRQEEKLASRHNHCLLSVLPTSQGQEVQLGLVAPRFPSSRLLSSAASRGWGILVGPESQYNSFLMLCFTTWL